MLGEIREFQGKDTYLVNDLLGRSPAYMLYLATARKSGQRFFVKTLDRNEYRLEQWLRREGAVLSTLDSPYIVRLCDIGQTHNSIFLVLEDVHGRLLSDWAPEQGPISEFMAIQFLRQLALALKASEQRGIVHQGLGPDSIFVCPPMNPQEEILVKLWDFGLASARKSSLTNELGEGFRRMGFWAPEQAAYEQDKTVIDIRTDIHAVGAVVYWLLTGVAPYEAENLPRLVMKIADPAVTPTDLTRIRPDLSPELVQVIQQCLAKTPDARFGSPAKLLQRLEQLSRTMDQLDYLHRRAERAAERGRWLEVLDIARRAEAIKGGNLLLQELARLAKQMLEKETADSIQNSLYNARSQLEQGNLAEADHYLLAMQKALSARPDLAERLDLRTELEQLSQLAQQQRAFKPARLLSHTNSATDSAHGAVRVYLLAKPLYRLGRLQPHTDPVAELDLIDLSAEPAGKTVSHAHAWLAFRDGNWMLKPDKNARNSTRVNGRVLPGYEEVPLDNHTQIRLGDVLLEFCLETGLG